VWLSISGCGGTSDPFERASVQGTVQLDGQPLPFGELFLKGKVSANGEAAQTFLQIRDGKFSSSGQTLPGTGSNEVMITVFSSDPDVADKEGRDAPVKGTWSGTTEVTGKEPLSFDLKSSELSKAG